MDINGIRAAQRRALDKLARQREAVLATETEVQMWENAAALQEKVTKSK